MFFTFVFQMDKGKREKTTNRLKKTTFTTKTNQSIKKNTFVKENRVQSKKNSTTTLIK